MNAHSPVPTLSLHGATMPRLGFGTWRLSGQACRDSVATAIDCGYRHIDTAVMYGNEVEVGAAVAASGLVRDAFFLTTKIWRDHLGYGDLMREAESCLDRLGCGYLDLLLVHWPNDAVPLAETMSALNEACRRGLTRHIGVSNFTSALLREAAAASETPILANQCEYHPGLDQSVLIDACRSAGTAFVSYRPLGQGKFLADPVIARIAGGHGRTAGQVILRWHLQQPGVVAIPRSATPAHIAENIGIFDFALSDDEMTAISALKQANSRDVSPAWAPAWDGPAR